MAELAVFGLQGLCALTGIAVTVGAYWFGVRQPERRKEEPRVVK